LFEDVFAQPGMENLRTQMLQAMLTTGGPDMANLEQALAHRDSVRAQHALHRMLGALQIFTNGPVIAEGRQLMAALAGPHIDDAFRQLPRYLETLRRVLEGLAEQVRR
jgi:hypothetical protein